MTIRTGLVGFGLGGQAFHAPYIAGSPEFELAAVVSSNPQKVHALYPGVPVAGDIHQIISAPEIDLVVISSPDHLHAEHALAAIAAGKHVVIDKPVATNLGDAIRIEQDAASSGRVVAAFQNRRWDADFLTLRELVRSGQLGRIVHFESHFDRWRPLDPSSWKEARSGGSWQDLGPHLIDQALVLFGFPQAVTADIAAFRDGAPAPDWFHVMLHYEGMRAILHSSKTAPDHQLRFAVHGTKGSWIKHGLDTQEPQALAGMAPGAEGFGLDPRPGLFTPANDVSVHHELANERGSYLSFWSKLARAITSGGENPVPVRDAVQTMTVLDAAQQSARDRRTIDIGTSEG